MPVQNQYEIATINFYIPRIQNADGGNVNKLELISALRQKMDLSKPEAAKIVDLFFDNMADALARGNRVEIRGQGKGEPGNIIKRL